MTCQQVHGTKLKERVLFQRLHRVSCCVGVFPAMKITFEKDETPPGLAFAPAPKADVGPFYNSACHIAR